MKKDEKFNKEFRLDDLPDEIEDYIGGKTLEVLFEFLINKSSKKEIIFNNSKDKLDILCAQKSFEIIQKYYPTMHDVKNVYKKGYVEMYKNQKLRNNFIVFSLIYITHYALLECIKYRNSILDLISFIIVYVIGLVSIAPLFKVKIFYKFDFSSIDDSEELRDIEHLKEILNQCYKRKFLRII